MAGKSNVIRGLQHIKSFTGKVNQQYVPHKIFMRITCIEMEKARRQQERESAMQRVHDIDARFKEIESEKKALLHALAKEGSKRRRDRGTHTQGKHPALPGKKGFRFRY